MQLELFINIYIFGRGGNHLCIDEYRSTQQNHVCRNGLICFTTEVDIKKIREGLRLRFIDD